MKKNCIILYGIILLTLLNSCSKYEDGPCISFRTPEKRIYGTYKLITYEVNGIDSLNYLYDSLGLIFKFFYDDINYKNICLNDDFRKDGLGSCLIWTWDLVNKAKILKINSSSCCTKVGPFGYAILPEWDILKLKSNKVHLKTFINNKEYYVEFKKY